MPRINTRKVNPHEVPRFCPNCGAANATAGLRCTICGHEFASPDAVSTMWGPEAQNQKGAAGDDFSGLYSAPVPDHVSMPIATAEIESTRPFTPVADPWSSSGGRLGADPGSGEKFQPPIGADSRKAGGPPGWILGFFGIVLILGVAAAAAWLVARPLVEDEITENASDGIEAAMAEVTIAAPVTPGTLIINEADVNRVLREQRDRFEPVRDIRVQIRRTGIEATMNVYGVSTTLTGDLAVEDGRLVIVDARLSGVARRLVDLDAITPRAESAVNDLLLRNGLEATDVRVADDTITLTTQPATP